jgi:hypothetical protein
VSRKRERELALAHSGLVTQAVREQAGEMEGVRFDEFDHVPPGAGRAFRLRY